MAVSSQTDGCKDDTFDCKIAHGVELTFGDAEIFFRGLREGFFGITTAEIFFRGLREGFFWVVKSEKSRPHIFRNAHTCHAQEDQCAEHPYHRVGTAGQRWEHLQRHRVAAARGRAF